VRSFNGRRWRGLVDVVSGGFPCQDISGAGLGTGIEGSRSGLWKEMARIIGEVLPNNVYLENSPLLVGRGLALVLGELTEMGYDAEWCVVSAADLGAPHKRDRIWLLAKNKEREAHALLAHSGSEHGQGLIAESAYPQIGGRPIQRSLGSRSDGFAWWPSEPDMGRVADGVAFRMDRLKALGNGQVPRVAATAFHGLRSGQW